MRSEIQIQLAGLPIDALFLPQYELPNVHLRPLTMKTCFQNNMCAETTLRAFAIRLILVILCEQIKVETESRNFLDLEAEHVYRWQ